MATGPFQGPCKATQGPLKRYIRLCRECLFKDVCIRGVEQENVFSISVFGTREVLMLQDATKTIYAKNKRLYVEHIYRYTHNNNKNNNNHLTQGPPRFLLTRVFFRRAPHPPIVGGVHHLKSPLLPPYPAIPPYVVRTPHPGITDDQAQKRAAKAPAAIHQLLGPIHLCHAQKPYTDGCSVERWRASIKASESPLA